MTPNLCPGAGRSPLRAHLSRPARRALLRATVLAAGVGLLSPAGALAADGGAGLGASSSNGAESSGSTSGSSSPFSSATSPIAAAPADDPVSAAADGLSISTHSAGTLRRIVTFTGSAPAGAAGETVEIQRQTGASGWSEVASASVPASETYTVHWRANRAGASQFRALLSSAGSAAGQPTAGTARSGAATPAVGVTVFTDAIATVYGPGFDGHRTACGQKLTPHTVGVASRTLRCGSTVTVYYHGQAVTVPVIDRGPFANHASWDLTEATATALGVSETETVGTIRG
jgi:rare lipoprotein A